MPLQAITSTEPIPGYRISERIGAGGYGEVWRADAPGGLVKAIKFVYGFLSEDRAARELKALNRIKSVRHPFLLSLERIEIVDGQLLIVTELADASLKDRFDECQKEGLPGIPWEELIRYMRDAADVLDYMSEAHSLQHLDIKPENLLLLAGRVKVADFGLVKDIHDATASIMGGLTPLYAPPEVFDGRPSRWSDQYSLAIVYQEMLTGELPFPGTTAIQLARQHLNARPRLSSLPERDQKVIARALSKSPRDRYHNCRELVNALQRVNAEESSGGTALGVTPSHDTSTGEQKRRTEVLDNVPSTGQWHGETDTVLIPRVHAEPVVRDLAPLDIDQRPVCMQPTLFLGVGRSAGRIMSRLRNRLANRFGSVESVPSLQLLLLDTDGKDLLQVSSREDGLTPNELLGIPLRRPQDYRADSGALLQWLSRRWLYNIPRSLKTEGIRPLGRLALVDHAQDIVTRIKGAVERATSEESLAKTKQHSGLEVESDTMRIVVIASISGGTGSGAVVDLGYLSRHLLGQMGFSDRNVRGVLTHSTGRNPRSIELSLVNAYATLTELNHYGRLGSHYPGEKACHVPARKDDNLAFHDTYLIDLGEELGEDEFDEAADKVAEYLYLDTTTAAGQFFQACRDNEPRHADTRNAEIPVRSFGLHQYSCMQDDVVSLVVEHLCRHATETWIAGTCGGVERPALRRTSVTIGQHADGTHESQYPQLRVLVEKLATSLELDVDSLIQELSRLIDDELGGSSDELIRGRMERITEHPPNSLEEWSARVLEVNKYLDQLLGSRENPETGRAEPGTLESSLAPRRRELAMDRARAVRDWLFVRVEDETERIRGAQWAARLFVTHCRDIENNLNDLRQNIDQELSQVHEQLDAVHSSRGRKNRDLASHALGALRQVCKLRLHEYVAASAGSVIQVVKGQVSSTQDELMDLERELRHLATQFDTSRTLDHNADDQHDALDDLAESIGQVLVDNVEQLANQLQCKLRDEVMQPVGGLHGLLMQSSDKRNKLPALMRGVARVTVVGILKQLDASDILFHDGEAPRTEVEKLAECLDAARPRLLACGGAKRLLVVLPKGSSQARPIEILHHEMNETPSVVENCEGDFILCYEAEQVSLTQAAVSFIDGRSDLAEAALRLHTRNDVNWSHLPDLVS